MNAARQRVVDAARAWHEARMGVVDLHRGFLTSDALHAAVEALDEERCRICREDPHSMPGVDHDCKFFLDD